MSSATFDFEVINIDALEELAKERTLLPYKKVNGKKDER